MSCQSPVPFRDSVAPACGSHVRLKPSIWRGNKERSFVLHSTAKEKSLPLFSLEAIVMRQARLVVEAIIVFIAAMLWMSVEAKAQDAARETTGALPQETPASTAGNNADSGPTETTSSGMILVSKRAIAVLAGPSSSASVLYGFPAGRSFRLIGREAGFAQIQDLKSSATGWIDETTLAQSSPIPASSVSSEANQVRSNSHNGFGRTKTHNAKSGVPRHFWPGVQ